MAFNLLARSPRRALRALSVTMAASALAAAVPPSVPSAPVADRTADSAQEVSLGALGLPAQAVFGPFGSVAVSMPAPMAPLATSGSFVQIFFMHSPLLAAPGSSVTLAVNGAPVATLPLDASSSEGATFDAPVPAFLLKGDGPNLIEARFVLRAPAGANASTTYARLDPQTLIHYQLLAAPGGHPRPGLQGYPFPLLGRGGLGRLGLVMPPQSSDAELGSAFRLAADLGRRAYLQEVLPQVVTAHPADWLRSSATPALLIGTLDRLPLAGDVLRAAGFRPGASWSGPAGEKISDSDGLVVPAVSPWDGRTPLLLVSGRTEVALASATQALAGAGAPPPSGAYLIAPPGGSGPAPRPAPPALVFPPGPDEGLALEALGAGTHTLNFPFVLPAVAANRAGLLELRLSHTPLGSTGAAALSIQLNGTGFAQVPLDATNQQEALVRLRPAGALLRPGLNSLTVTVRLAGEVSNSDSLVARQWVRLGPGIRLLPPPPPSGEAPLESLPGSLFDGAAGLLVVVEHRDDAWLSASARALAALGSRSTEVPPLEVAGPRDARTTSRGARSAIAIGAVAVAALESRDGGPGGSAPHLPGRGSGTVYVSSLADAPPARLLCLATGAPEVVAAAAAGLYRRALHGPAMGLDAAGASWSVRPDRHDRSAGPSLVDTLVALRVLFTLAIAAMMVAVGCQLGGLLVASCALAAWCSRAVGSGAGTAAAVKLRMARSNPPVVGRERADWELVEAGRAGRLVTLGLLGVDAPAEDEVAPEDRIETMRQLDEVLRAALPSEEMLCEYGPWERLLVLTDVWAEDFRDTAGQLVKVARQRLRRQVRVALISFPRDGSRTSNPVDYLERALEVCRAGRTSVSVGRPRVSGMTPNAAGERVESA